MLSIFTPVRAASCCRRAVDSAWARAPLKSAEARASDTAGLFCPVSPSTPPRLSRSSASALFRARSSPTSLQPRVLHPASESRGEPSRGQCVVSTVCRLPVPGAQGGGPTHCSAWHGDTWPSSGDGEVWDVWVSPTSAEHAPDLYSQELPSKVICTIRSGYYPTLHV